MESLTAACCLWASGLGERVDYRAELDRLFLENPEDDLLLELENFGDDCAAALARLLPYLQAENCDKFGRALVSGLETAFRAGGIPLREFGERCYKMWRMLPDETAHQEPFVMLGYADEPLSWGDEEQSRELFAKMFGYYL